MSEGLLYVAFGKEYDALAAATVFYSRRFTDLPICVLTNLKERSKKWKGIKNIKFRYFPLHLKENRSVKTRMIQFSPFDLTLYMDCDNVIQKNGMDEIFRLLEDNDLLLSVYMTWKKGNKVLGIYKRMMKQTKVELPITIHHGGFQLFRKNESTHSFFNLWNEYWKLGGMGRDMPALNCAVKNSGVIVKGFGAGANIYSAERESNNAIIQHRYSSDFFKKFGLPKWRPWKPFDKHKTDFSWIEF